MPSADYEKLVDRIRRAPPDNSSIAERRRGMDLVDQRIALPEGMRVMAALDAPSRTEWLVPATHGARVVMYVHGGGFQLGSVRSHRHIAAYLADRAEARGLIFDFGLAPEAPYPAGQRDCLATYRWLIGQVAAAEVVLAGDSSGAAMAVEIALGARDAGLPLPAGIAVLSPLLDMVTHIALPDGDYADPTVNPAWARTAMAAYIGDHDPRDPGISPFYADLAGLPPIFVQTGAEEFLTVDVHRFAALCARAGVPVEIEAWPGMIHVWQWFAPRLPEATAAIARLADFVRRVGR